MRQHVHGYLFANGELDDNLKAKLEDIENHVNRIPKERFLNTSNEELILKTSQAFTFEPLNIHRDKMLMHEPKEAKIENPSTSKGGFRPGRPQLIDGIEIQIEIPFSGNSNLFDLKPNESYAGNHPKGIIKHGSYGIPGIIIMKYKTPVNQDFNIIKKDIEDNISMIEEYIGWQNNQLADYNSKVEIKARQHVEHRRKNLSKQEDISKILGIPLAKKKGPL